MKHVLRRVVPAVACALAATVANAQGSYQFLPAGFTPVELSADGRTVVGKSGTAPAYYRISTGVVFLPSSVADTAQFVSADGSIILGSYSKWINGVRYANDGARGMSDDGQYFLYHTSSSDFIKGPTGQVELDTLHESKTSYSVSFMAPDGKTAYGSWSFDEPHNTEWDTGGVAYGPTGTRTYVGTLSWVAAVTLHGEHRYIKDLYTDRETGEGDPHWAVDVTKIKSIATEKWFHQFSVARDNSLASDGRDLYLPDNAQLRPLLDLLSASKIDGLAAGLSDVRVQRISGDGLTLLGSGVDSQNVRKYWLAQVALQGVPDDYAVAPNATYNQAAPGVLGNDTYALGATCVLVSTTTHGTLNLNSNGAFSYTPAHNFIGQDSFTYRLVKGTSMSAAIAVKLRVGAVASLDIPAVIGGGGYDAKGASSVTLNFTALKNEVVVLSSSQPDAASVPATTTIVAGTTKHAFTIVGHPISSSVHVTITASYNGGSVSKDLLVAVAIPRYVGVGGTSFVGGNGVALSGMIYMWTGAPPAGMSIAMQSSDPTALKVPPSVWIANYYSVTFKATTFTVSTPKSVTITASANGGTASCTVVVRPTTLKSLDVAGPVRSGMNTTAAVSIANAIKSGDPSYLVKFSVNDVDAGSIAITQGSSATGVPIRAPIVAATTTVTVKATGPDGSVVTAPLTVQSAVLTGFTGRTPSINGGLTAIADLHYDGVPAKVQPVVYASSNTDVIPTPGQTGGAMAKSIPTKPVTSTVDVTLSATFEGVTQSYAQRVIPAQLASLSVTPSSVIGGTHITGSIEFIGIAAVSSRVGLTSSNPAVVPVPVSANVAAGKNVQTFDIPTNPVSSNTTVTITATYRGIQRTATVTVTP